MPSNPQRSLSRGGAAVTVPAAVLRGLATEIGAGRTPPMTAPASFLQVLTRNELLVFADVLKVEVVDRRVKGLLVEALSGVEPIRLGEVLRTFPRDRLKELCRTLQLDDSGKAKAPLVERLLAYGKPRTTPRAAAASPRPARKPRSAPEANGASITRSKAVPSQPRSLPTPSRSSPSSSMTTNASQLAAYIWSLADLLRGIRETLHLAVGPVCLLHRLAGDLSRHRSLTADLGNRA